MCSIYVIDCIFYSSLTCNKDIITKISTVTNQVVNVEEVPTWLAGNHLPALPIATLLSWKETGPRNLNIENCTDFCDPLILTNIIGQKVQANRILIAIFMVLVLNSFKSITVFGFYVFII